MFVIVVFSSQFVDTLLHTGNILSHTHASLKHELTAHAESFTLAYTVVVVGNGSVLVYVLAQYACTIVHQQLHIENSYVNHPHHHESLHAAVNIIALHSFFGPLSVKLLIVGAALFHVAAAVAQVLRAVPSFALYEYVVVVGSAGDAIVYHHVIAHAILLVHVASLYH